MTPKDKAVELVDKYRTCIRIADKYDNNVSEDEIYLAKQCALIAVDEILKSNPCKFIVYEYEINRDYWQEVKQEIEKL